MILLVKHSLQLQIFQITHYCLDVSPGLENCENQNRHAVMNPDAVALYIIAVKDFPSDETIGAEEGKTVGLRVGNSVGDTVGKMVGSFVGDTVGKVVGANVVSPGTSSHVFLHARASLALHNESLQ